MEATASLGELDNFAGISMQVAGMIEIQVMTRKANKSLMIEHILAGL